jgi:hypothetical protein
MPIGDAEKWRARHRQRGERYRWFKALRCGCESPRQCAQCDADGRVYIEQAMPVKARALVHSTQTEMTDKEFGVFPQGSTMISVMPDESPLVRLDRVVLTERRRTVRAEVTRGATSAGTGNSDAFIHAPVVAITDVRKGATVYALDVDYVLTESGLTWLGSNKPANGERFAVEYAYTPTYVFLEQNDKPPRPDHEGVFMPQRGLLMMRQPG